MLYSSLLAVLGDLRLHGVAIYGFLDTSGLRHLSMTKMYSIYLNGLPRKSCELHAMTSMEQHLYRHKTRMYRLKLGEVRTKLGKVNVSFFVFCYNRIIFR